MPRLTLALALAALASSAAAQTEQRSITGASVAIYNLVGRVRAEAGSGDAVTVEITRRGAGASQLRVETGPIRDRQTLRIVYPADRIVYSDYRGGRSYTEVHPDGTFGDGWGDGDRVAIRGSGPGLEAHADLVVRIPAGRKVELYLAVGRMDVVNVEGDIVVDVQSADVEVAGVKGTLSLDTGSGHITVRDVTGDLYIDSGSGGVTVDRVKGSILNLDSGSGSVQGSDLEVQKLSADIGSGGLRLYRVKATDVSVETGSGGATVELLTDVERLEVESGSGGVTVRAPANLGAEVSIETGSGGFQTDYEITTRRMSRNNVEGRIGDGQGRIRIESGSGTIRLLKG